MWSPLLTQRQPLKLCDIWGKSLQITGLSYFYHGYSCNYSCSVRYKLSLKVMFATHSNFWLLFLMSPRQYLDFPRNDPDNSERQSPIHWKVFGQKRRWTQRGEVIFLWPQYVWLYIWDVELGIAWWCPFQRIGLICTQSTSSGLPKGKTEGKNDVPFKCYLG